MFKKKDLKLTVSEKENKAFDVFNTLKKDAFSMPSKFYATTVFYPKTATESQTFLTTINAQGYLGKDKIGEIYKTDEFDTRKDALKWIKLVYKEFIQIIE